MSIRIQGKCCSNRVVGDFCFIYADLKENKIKCLKSNEKTANILKLSMQKRGIGSSNVSPIK
jgi:hypothetical protein